jgi:hypothetical protein
VRLLLRELDLAFPRREALELRDREPEAFVLDGEPPARVLALLRPLEVLPPPRVVVREFRALLPRDAPLLVVRLDRFSEERLRVLARPLLVPRPLADSDWRVVSSRASRLELFFAAVARDPALFRARDDA